MIVGLILVRWVAAVTASPAAPPARSSSTGGSLPSIRALAPLELTPGPADQIDMLAAYDEAMRLGQEALLDDNLEAARDLYFLASEALPGDPEAEARVRQLDTVLGIVDRTAAWREALDDVEDLLAQAPRAPTIMRAYTEALVGAGSEALTQGNTLRAVRLCGEAAQRAPARNDASLCSTQAAATATAIPRVTPSVAAISAPAIQPPAQLPSSPATQAPLPSPSPTAIQAPLAPSPPAPSATPRVVTNRPL